MIGTTRIGALVDGIFAIAMTLLAFDLKVSDIIVPGVSHNLLQVLSGIWPQILIYTMSFLILGFYWIEHRIQFRYVKYYDKNFMWINIFFLMFIALIPFSTGILGRYLGEQFSIILYGVNIIIIGAMSYFHWWYVNSHHLMGKDITLQLKTTINKRIIFVLIIAGSSIIISFFSFWISHLIYASIPLYYIFMSRSDMLKR